MSRNLPPTTRSLPIALMRARESVMAPIRQMLLDEGITEQQWRILRVLSESGQMNATDICEKASLLAPSFTRIAVSMTNKGLMSRSSNQKDRRSHSFKITEAGQQIIDKNLPRAVEIGDALKVRLGAERFELLLDLLEDLAQSSAAQRQPYDHTSGGSDPE